MDTTTLEFPVLLRLIDERATAFRAAVAAAADLTLPVPSCPDWTLLDLVRHLGGVHRRWAAIVTAGPADAPPERPAIDAPEERGGLLAWSAESTRLLLDALRDAGPERGCWAWWVGSQSPHTSGAVARHQVQEAMVHTYDAQLTIGAPQPLPDEAALDGVDEFLSTCCAGTDPWPFAPATAEYHVTEGRSWRLSMSAEGVRVTRLDATAAPEDRADACGRISARELVLVLYGRLPIDAMRIDGDRRVFEQLRDWDPDA